MPNSNSTRNLFKCYRFGLLLVNASLIIPSTYYVCAHNKQKAKELVISANSNWIARGGKLQRVKVQSSLDIIQFGNLARSSNNTVIENREAFDKAHAYYLAKIARRKEKERIEQEKREMALADLQMV